MTWPMGRGNAASWWAATTVAMVGAVGFAYSDALVWNLLLVAGGLVLAGRLAHRVGMHRSRRAASIAALGLLVVVVGALGPDGASFGMPRLDTAIMAVGFQLYFFAVVFGAHRGVAGGSFPLVGLLGHVVVAVASAQVAPGSAVVDQRHVIWYATGFTLILVHAFWVQRSVGVDVGPATERWEAPFLFIQSAALAVVAVVSVVLVAEGIDAEGARRTVAAVIRFSTIGAVAIMAGPPRAPGFMEAEQDSAVDVLLNAAAFTFLVNVILLALFLASDILIVPIFIALTGWLAVAVAFEYASSFHALATRRRTDATGAAPSPGVEGPITAVVAARNEASILADSVRRNLASSPALNLLLVPAASSTDATLEVAEQLARDHPERVRVVVGRGGSKAADLNAAWEAVDTEFVVILDADEVLEPGALARAVAILRENPEVGIVQGRKVARGPDRHLFDRFIAAERRFSTRLDQWFLARVFDAAHFAGSGALLRREVPASVGGWTDASLTEDIEFTMRLYLQTSWRIVYEPWVIVWQARPRTTGDLLHQRSRWARGWSQVYQLHMASILRNAGKVGPRRTIGLTWQMLTAVSAPWSLFLPALALLWLFQGSPITPGLVGLTLGLAILPSRALAYLIAVFGDPVAPRRPTPARVLEAALTGYLWVLVGWFLQLHALYLEASHAEGRWFVTGKRATG